MAASTARRGLQRGARRGPAAAAARIRPSQSQRHGPAAAALSKLNGHRARHAVLHHSAVVSPYAVSA